MAVDYFALRADRPRRFQASATAWGDLAREFTALIGDHQGKVVDPVNDGSWTGRAATAGKAAVADDHAKMIATAKYLEALQALLAAAYDGADKAHVRSDQAVQAAAGLPIDEDGNVNLTFSVGPVPWDAPPILAAMKAQNMINQAVHMANVVDDELAPYVRLALKFDAGGQGPWRTDADRDLDRVVQAGQDMQARLQGIPKDEPQHHDTPAQPYDDEWPNPEDVALKAAFMGVAVPYFEAKGWPHAAGMFANWLLGTGNTAYVDPARMMADIPSFGQLVAKAVALGAYGHFDTGWQNTSTQDASGSTQSLDWWYAMNDFRYRVVGRSVTTGGRTRVHYTVGVLKPYVFGPPRNPIPIPILSKIVPGAQVDQESIEHLHRAGFARNFIIQGIRQYVS